MTKSALITGGAKRIGREVALFLASQGYNLAISCHNSQIEAEKLANEINEKFSVKCQIFVADLSKKEQAKSLIEKVLHEFPNLNLLINNASIFEESDLFANDEEIEENFALHFFSPLILTKKFTQNAREKNVKNAQIINFVDKNIARFDTHHFYYLLSKKLLAKFTQMSSLQTSPQVRVNAIAPGFILEDPYLQANPEIAQKITQKIPLQKKGEVKNITQTIEFLLKNDFINGQILFVDGGASLNHAG